MKTYQHHTKFLKLRADYSTFYFESVSIEKSTTQIKAQFHFHIDDCFHFHPQITLDFNSINIEILHSEDDLKNILFYCGMVELISYWKSTCAPTIAIKEYSLDDEQVAWWKKLYYHGLGEFFYLNGIHTNQIEFVQIKSLGKPAKKISNTKIDSNKVIIPIGGGKDSPVTLELIKNAGYEVLPLIINPRGATINTLTAAGLSQEHFIKIEREIDPLLLKMNSDGYLNGHTPFSAMLAFYSLLSALVSHSKYIALSNESSANESTVKDSDVNHQYSKSFQFESDFRAYYKKYIFEGIDYFSFLRPISELQIASLFATMKKYHPIFRSCNVGSKEDKWCGHCPKCLFAAIIISPFLKPEEVRNIFNRDILNDEDMREYLDELTGKKEVKPFECVGTTAEVNIALAASIHQYAITKERIPALLVNIDKLSLKELETALNVWNNEHFLPVKLEKILKNALRIK